MTKTLILLIMLFFSFAAIAIIIVSDRLEELKKLIGIVVKSIIGKQGHE